MLPLWGWLIVAGVAGALLRAWRDHGQETWGRETLTDAVVGGLVGVFLPAAVAKLAPTWSLAYSAPYYQIIGVFLFGFVASLAWLVAVRQRVPQFFQKQIGGGS
jgi:hypothetical protein